MGKDMPKSAQRVVPNNFAKLHVYTPLLRMTLSHKGGYVTIVTGGGQQNV
jgi:hypothetical protein